MKKPSHLRFCAEIKSKFEPVFHFAVKTFGHDAQRATTASLLIS